jgi:hypothetical protein
MVGLFVEEIDTAPQQLVTRFKMLWEFLECTMSFCAGIGFQSWFCHFGILEILVLSIAIDVR